MPGSVGIGMNMSHTANQGLGTKTMALEGKTADFPLEILMSHLPQILLQGYNTISYFGLMFSVNTRHNRDKLCKKDS